ncbi:MAG TPA: FxLYD domain-containing protein [Bryobacteraceae bacterium]|nr:FxLYD domain-containing protein [Bryobacteraceae bacterium]
MDAMPSAGAEEPSHHRKRRKKTSSWGALALIVVCIVGGLAVPLVRTVMPRYKLRGSALPLSPEEKADLTLSEAAFQGEGAQRAIAGTVRNSSTHRYTNVVVTLNLHVNSESTVALAVARIPRIEPHATAPFQTSPVPANVRRFLIRDIAGERE